MTDEMLLACYIDGEMGQEDRANFESRCTAEPALAARLKAWRERDAAIAQDFAALLAAGDAPNIQPASGVAAASQPIDLAARRRQLKTGAIASARYPQFSGKRWAIPAALAASLAFVVLFSIPLLTQQGNSPLAPLDTLATGQSAELADGQNLTPALTFAAADGRWCREYSLRPGANSMATSGIACREDGEWRVQGETETGGAPAAGSAQGYATAGGSSSAPLDRIYDQLAPDDPLGPDDEARLIENGWIVPGN